MGKEIERKYLVKPGFPRTADQELIQGYISTERHATIRVRIAGDKAFLTIKGPTQGITRDEWEYLIPRADADQMMKSVVQGPVIAKVRYHTSFAGKEWTIDEFHGDNQGLVLAEIELASESEAYELPPWVGEDVSADMRYTNSNLAKHPFKNW